MRTRSFIPSQKHPSGLSGLACRAFGVAAEQAAGDSQAKMKRLSREMRNLHGKTALPVHMASSLFVRHNSDRMDKVRAMITGTAASPPDSPMHKTPSLVVVLKLVL